MRPTILTATKVRVDKMKNAGPVVAVKIKVAGGGEMNTIMQNPYHLQGDGFNVGKALNKAGRVIKTAAPIVGKASDLAMAVGAATGHPEIVAAGAVGRAAATLAGGSKKKQQKAMRYHLTEEL
jgi:hypothetical protein